MQHQTLALGQHHDVESNESMKVNLFIIGAGKSGTTSLWNFLNQHKDVCMCPTKEPSFFSNSKYFDRGLNWYHGLFSNYQNQPIVGEASNSYSATGIYPDTPLRIFNYNPSAKLIYVVRHPKDRTESDWMEANKRNQVGFSQFLRTDELSRDKNRYLKQYSVYTQYFPQNAILTLTFEDLTGNFPQAKTKIFDFIGLSDIPNELSTQRATADQKKRTRLYYWFNQSEIYAHVRRFIPEPIRRAATLLTSRKYAVTRPTWHIEDRIWFEQTYRSETEEFFSATKNQCPPWTW